MLDDNDVRDAKLAVGEPSGSLVASHARIAAGKGALGIDGPRR